MYVYVRRVWDHKHVHLPTSRLRGSSQTQERVIIPMDIADPTQHWFGDYHYFSVYVYSACESIKIIRKYHTCTSYGHFSLLQCTLCMYIYMYMYI